MARAGIRGLATHMFPRNCQQTFQYKALILAWQVVSKASDSDLIGVLISLFI